MSRSGCQGGVTLHPLVRSNGEIVLWGTAIGNSLSFGKEVRFGGGGLCGDVGYEGPYWSMVRFDHDGKLLGGYTFPFEIRPYQVALDSRDGLLINCSTSSMASLTLDVGCGPLSTVGGDGFLVHYRADFWPEQSAGN